MAADSPDYNGFNLTGGVRFGFYADVNRGIHKDSVAIWVRGKIWEKEVVAGARDLIGRCSSPS